MFGETRSLRPVLPYYQCLSEHEMCLGATLTDVGQPEATKSSEKRIITSDLIKNSAVLTWSNH